MIRLEEVATENIAPLSIEIKKGSACKIIAASEDAKNDLLDAILGVRKPSSGRVFLFDREIYSIPAKECLNFFRRTGVVLSDGGTISNIKVWENITLPVWYHSGKKPADIEDSVIEIYKQLGVSHSYLSEHIGRLPGPLPAHEKRIIGLVRALLMEPELMLYDSLLEGMGQEMTERLERLTAKFHAEKSGRTSVYITTNELSVKNVQADTVVRI
ncbi:MAG: ATP-binding cassette domain-containing protein [Nitrospirae bacterium]|nr:ATP-binding cassette domain-containing protein [Nitrospirota bacterium]